ncbi:HXXEE domain-containing protein [Cryobacterium serini]|uniref:HXXEE domain-containing protein n=1 Tax=Cryobacterium serini TaxID=1259201 RepID=UPI00141B10A4|nr:HXXEE domain-containing protein [Cryobacterium serini]
MSIEPSGTRIAAVALFAAWLVHDVEEVFTFPATSRLLAARLGTDRVVVSPAQSGLAIALMGVLVGAACVRGARTQGKSRLYRAVLAGLEAHVVTHVATSISFKSYTAGLITAPLVMLPGARVARAELLRGGSPLLPSDTVHGGVLLFAAAIVSHFISRLFLGAGCPRVRIPRT